MDLAAVLDKTLAARKEIGLQKLPRIAQTWADSLAGIANTLERRRSPQSDQC